jgi:hypothetical protein
VIPSLFMVIPVPAYAGINLAGIQECRCFLEPRSPIRSRTCFTGVTLIFIIQRSKGRP